jgi:hypothetical protein
MQTSGAVGRENANAHSAVIVREGGRSSIPETVAIELKKPRRTGYPASAGYDDCVQSCDLHVIASEAKQSISRRAETWIAFLRSQ